MLVADDLEAYAQKYQRYLGAAPSRNGNAIQFRLALGTTLTIVDLRNANDMLPGTLLPPIPGIAAVAFRTPALAALRERLAGQGFTVATIGDRILVPAEEACGVAMLFGS